MNTEDYRSFHLAKRYLMSCLSVRHNQTGDIEELHSLIDMLAIELHEYVDEELK